MEDLDFLDNIVYEEDGYVAEEINLDDLEETPVEESPQPKKKAKKTKKTKKEEIDENQVKCTMKVVRIRFPRKFEENTSNFGILEIEPIDVEYGLITPNYKGEYIVKGNMPPVNYYDTYTIIAKEMMDEKWGKQYNLVYIGNPIKLDDEEKQKIFLSKILAEGQFEALYNALPNPFEAIMNQDIVTLTSVKGIGAITATKIIDKYKEAIDYSDAYVELDAFGLTARMIEKLVETFGSPQLAISKVKTNPYILADEVDGIGFKKADQLALKSGIDEYSPLRIEAFIKYYLNQEALKGNSYLDRRVLMRELKNSIGEEINMNELKELLGKMIEESTLWRDDTRVALYSYYTLEMEIASELLRIAESKNEFRYDVWESVVVETEKMQGWNFTDQQKEGILVALQNQCVMITGYGGTGKSSIVKGMLDVLERYTYAMCALAGKASARLAEVTGQPDKAYTIHRLLAYDPRVGGFTYTSSQRLPYDIVIVDEVSMIGGQLFYSLVQAVRDGAKLIMLCDIGQLESIGSLNIAKDIIESGVIPTVTLTEIHRQARKSAIVTESLKIREGIQITDSIVFEETEVRGELEDLILTVYDDRSYTSPYIVGIFKKQLAEVDDIMDLQVIVPMKEKGEASTYKLNQKLQEIYNPASFAKKEITIGLKNPYILRVGDKVINTKNNYKTYDIQGNPVPIFNGNIGIIAEIDKDGSYMIVKFQFIGDIIVRRDHWLFIELGYAMTCHKSQGSEFRIAIVGLDYSAYTGDAGSLMTREWIYTAITRAKKKCFACFENRALRKSIDTSNVSKKQTFLPEFLKSI